MSGQVVDRNVEYTVHPCEVIDCNRLAYFSRYCSRCEEEIGAMARLAADREARLRRKRALRRAHRRSGLFLGLEIAVVVGGGIYLALTFGAAWLQWLGRL